MLAPLTQRKEDKKATGRELVCALYEFIVNASIEEKLIGRHPCHAAAQKMKNRLIRVLLYHNQQRAPDKLNERI